MTSTIVIMGGCVGTLKVADVPLHSMHSGISKANHNTIIKNSKIHSKSENNTTKENLLKK